MPHRLIGRTMRRDVQDGGPGRIAGTVAVDASPDVPVRRRVRLFHRESGRLVRETWSDATTGAYEFAGLAIAEYFVLAHDHTAEFNAVVKDAITPQELNP